MVESRRSGPIRGVVLGNGLHRPFQTVTSYIPHGGVKPDSRRIDIESNGADKLNSRLGIGWAGELDLTLFPFRKFPKVEWPVVQHVGVSHPMLFVLVPLGQQPQLVASVVEPLA